MSDKPQIIKQKEAGNVTVLLCKAAPLYDIVIQGETKHLEKVKVAYNSESEIIEASIYGKPVMVLDTFTELEDAKESYDKFEEMLND